MQFKSFPSLVAMQTYFMLSLKVALERFTGELLMEAAPYITITSVVFSLLFIIVEKKLDTKQ